MLHKSVHTKFNNLHETNLFPPNHKFPKLTEDEIENPSVLPYKSEFVVTTIMKKESSGPWGFVGKFYKIFKKNK